MGSETPWLFRAELNLFHGARTTCPLEQGMNSALCVPDAWDCRPHDCTMLTESERRTVAPRQASRFR